MSKRPEKPSVPAFLLELLGLDHLGPVPLAFIVFTFFSLVTFWTILVVAYIASFIPDDRQRLYGLWLVVAGVLGNWWSTKGLQRLRDEREDD
jgi:hypothetical protein